MVSVGRHTINDTSILPRCYASYKLRTQARHARHVWDPGTDVICDNPELLPLEILTPFKPRTPEVGRGSGSENPYYVLLLLLLFVHTYCPWSYVRVG